MIIDGLEFFTKTNDPARIIVASWHSPHSLTWRWLVSWARFKADERRAHWRLLWWHRDNNGLQWFLLMPWLGRLEWSQQRPIWYRDLYVRQRDEQDTERYLASTARHDKYQRQKAAAIRGDAPLH